MIKRAGATPSARPATAARAAKSPDNTWDALASGGSKPPRGWQAPTTDRAKYTLPAQKAALKQCDQAVAALKKALSAKKLPAELQGIRPKDVSVDTLGDFPYVTVKKDGKALFDRQGECEALRRLLPESLRRVPIGDVSPF